MRGGGAAILALLTGCGGGGPAPLPTGAVRAYFPKGAVADTIEVDAIDRLALRRADLVAPDGQTTAALSIAARPAPSDATLLLPTGAEGGGGFGTWRPRRKSAECGGGRRRGADAKPALRDRVECHDRAPPTRWPIVGLGRRSDRLRFGDPPKAESREIAAPEPPPAADGRSPPG